MPKKQESKHVVNAVTSGNPKRGGGRSLNNISRPNKSKTDDTDTEVSIKLSDAARGFYWLWIVATVFIAAFVGYTMVVHGSAMDVHQLTVDGQAVQLSELYDLGCYEMCAKIKPISATNKTIIHYLEDNAKAYEKNLELFQAVIVYLLVTLAYVLLKAFEVIKRGKENAGKIKRKDQRKKT